MPRPFLKLWLIGIAKVTGSIALTVGTLVGGAELIGRYPIAGDVLAWLLIVVVIGTLGMLFAPKR